MTTYVKADDCDAAILKRESRIERLELALRTIVETPFWRGVDMQREAARALGISTETQVPADD